MTFFITASNIGVDGTWVDDFSNTFETGADASAWCKTQNTYYSSHWSRSLQERRYRVRKVVDTDSDNFYSREEAKNHTPLPWKSRMLTEEYHKFRLPHVDPDTPFMVRFFQSIHDAVEGRYTSVGFRRFLSNYEDYDEDDVTDILVELGFYGGKTEFAITNDAAMIADIYTNGPDSCMNDPENYELPDTHPSIVYSKGDLAVAYLKDSNGHYTARAVVYPEKKLYYCIYGHAKLLKAELIKLGYRFEDEEDAWEGARIGAIPWDEDDDYYLIPYVDACPYGELDGEYIILRSNYTDGYLDIRITDGYTN